MFNISIVCRTVIFFGLCRDPAYIVKWISAVSVQCSFTISVASENLNQYLQHFAGIGLKWAM